MTPAVAGLGVLALGALGYLLSRADELHAQPLLVILCALLPIAAASVDRAALVAIPLALILLAGVANRLSALVLPPDLEPVRLAGVPGIRVPPAEARGAARAGGRRAARGPGGRAGIRGSPALRPRDPHRPAPALPRRPPQRAAARRAAAGAARGAGADRRRARARAAPRGDPLARPGLRAPGAERARPPQRLHRARRLPGPRLRAAGAATAHTSCWCRDDRRARRHRPGRRRRDRLAGAPASRRAARRTSCATW